MNQIGLPWCCAARLAATPLYEVLRPHLSSLPVLSRSESEKMAERGKSSASSVAIKLVTLLLMQMTSLVTLRSFGSSHTCSVIWNCSKTMSGAQAYGVVQCVARVSLQLSRGREAAPLVGCRGAGC